MQVVATFQEPEGAHLLRAFLASHGISAHLFDEHLVQMVWHYSNAIGGVRVMVADDELEEATQCTRDYFARLNTAPKEISVPRAWPLVLPLSYLCGIPMLLFGRKKGIPLQAQDHQNPNKPENSKKTKDD